jgi:hypothetical protein
MSPSATLVFLSFFLSYALFLTDGGFIVQQKRDDARRFLKFLHPELGLELKERSYGADCRIYTPENPTNKFANVWDTLFDEFVIAHILGWWGKAIMVRNLPLLWVLSIGFEVMEVGHLYAGLSLPSSFLLGMGCMVTMWKPNSKCLYSFLTNLCT